MKRDRRRPFADAVVGGIGPNPLVPALHRLGITKPGPCRHQHQRINATAVVASECVRQPQVAAEAVADQHDPLIGVGFSDAGDDRVKVGQPGFALVRGRIGRLR